MSPLLAAVVLIAQSPEQFTLQARTGKADWQGLARKLGVPGPGQEAPCTIRKGDCHVERLDLAVPAAQSILVVFDEQERQAYVAFRKGQPTGVFFASARARRASYRVNNAEFLCVSQLGVSGSDWYSEPEVWLELGDGSLRPVFQTETVARENANGFGISTDVMSHVEQVDSREILERVHVEMSLIGNSLGSRTYWAVFRRARSGVPFQLDRVYLDRVRNTQAGVAEFRTITQISVDGVPGRQKMLVKMTATALRELAVRQRDLRSTVARILAENSK